MDWLHISTYVLIAFLIAGVLYMVVEFLKQCIDNVTLEERYKQVLADKDAQLQECMEAIAIRDREISELAQRMEQNRETYYSQMREMDASIKKIVEYARALAFQDSQLLEKASAIAAYLQHPNECNTQILQELVKESIAQQERLRARQKAQREEVYRILKKQEASLADDFADGGLSL